MLKGHNSKGFTLLELLIVIALIGILISMAASTMARTSHRAATKSLSETITGLIAESRINAMTSGAVVALCPVSNISVSNPSCISWDKLIAGNADNKFGWVIFKDNNSDGKIDDIKDIISRMAFDDFGRKVGVKKDNSKEIIRYTRKGELASGSRTLIVGSKVPKYSGKGYDREVIIAVNTGRVRNVLKRDE